jgi:hypothetical protein
VPAKSPDFWLASSSYNGVATDSTGRAQFNVTTFALGGLTGNIVLSSSGLTSGLNGSFSPATVPTTGTTVFTVTKSASTPKGTYPITILANLGNITRTMTLSLVVR